jgi:hypothetical protein
MNTHSSKRNASKKIAVIAAPVDSTTATANTSIAGESTIVDVNVPSATLGVGVDATSTEATAPLAAAKPTKVQNPYKKQSAVPPAGAATKSRGITIVNESTIATINISDVNFNDATTTSANFAIVKNPYKKQAALVPALLTSTVTSNVTGLDAASSVTACVITVSGNSGMLYADYYFLLCIVTPSVTYIFYLLNLSSSFCFYFILF